ncbi:HTH-type transcriptional regulator MalT [compost metagenome]
MTNSTAPTPPASARLRRTKLQPPPVRSAALQRADLLARIREGAAARLILVHAPAGFGKSTIMRQAFETLPAAGRAVAWLTLDDADNDAARFVSHLVGALQDIAPELAISAHEVPGAIDLADQLVALSQPFTLFLDDFEALRNPTVLALVRQVADDLPAHGQLLIGSRRLPDIGLGRFRAHGELLEISAADLRFSAAETADFLRRHRGLALDDEQLQRLQQRTEGWVTALWLVSLALQGGADAERFIETFDGTNAALGDYLLEDVLARQPQELRDFLIRSSLLDELCAPLCDHVLQRDDSAALLARTEQAQLFLIPQDNERRWYRYHPLFREFLRNQLRQASARDLPALHRRASDWYAEAQRPVPAIEHALRSGDTAHTLALLEAHAESLLWQGRTRLLARWFETPALNDRLLQHPQLLLTRAWGLGFSPYPTQAMQMLRRLPEPDTGAPGDTALRGQAEAVQAFVCAMTDDIHQATQRWQHCLQLLSPEQAFAYGILVDSYGFCLTAANRFDEAQAFLERGSRIRLNSGNSFIVTMAQGLLALIEIARGQLRSAVARLRNALASDGPQSVRYLSGSVLAVTVLAEALYERDELAEAERLLNLYLPMVRDSVSPDHLIASYLTLSRIARLAGDSERADLLLAELEGLGHGKAQPRLVASARLEHARIALLQGSLQNAAALLDKAGEARVWAPYQGLAMHSNDIDSPLLGRIRLDLHGGRTQQAVETARQALEEAHDQQRQRRALKLQILLGQALCAGGEEAEGRRHLLDALQFAASEGFVRTFADEGPALLAVLAQLRGSRMPDAAKALLERLLAGHGEPPLAEGVEPLTEKELRVLRLSAEGLRNREIAERLFVSETTVRTHLRNINTKLGSHSRTHAVAIARQCGWL